MKAAQVGMGPVMVRLGPGVVKNMEHDTPRWTGAFNLAGSNPAQQQQVRQSSHDWVWFWLVDDWSVVSCCW